MEHLKQFKMVEPGNTCTITGEWIAPGEVCYARNADEVRNGRAISKAEYKRMTAPPPVPEKEQELLDEQKPETPVDLPVEVPVAESAQKKKADK